MISLHLLTQNIIYLVAGMDLGDGEWEGFQNCNDEPKYDFAKAPEAQSKQQTIQEQQQIQEKPLFHKKITFRAKNKRKTSFMLNPTPKKVHNQQILQKIIPQRYVQIDKSKRIGVVVEKKEGIPIFRESAVYVSGELIYKNAGPATAEEYISRAEERREGGSGDLAFSSNFQGGNLEQVVKQNNQYHLYITADTNTKGHKQWFYFTICPHTSLTAKLVIHSFKKKLSLFQIGMKPYGKYRYQSDEKWRPVGSNIRYLRSVEKYRRGKVNERKYEFILTFDLELQKNVELCVASSIPYSYTYLCERLKSFSFPPLSKIRIKEDVLCKTLTGVSVPLLTINPTAEESRRHRYVIINARTHPGESSSSWVLDGMLAEIMNSTILQSLILEFHVVLKIVPMLNVDGVFAGNYRTGIMGVDFNRLFLTGPPDLFPEIHGLKQLVEECKKSGRVDLFLDLHGHSILPGCFMYGPDPLFAPATSLGMLTKEMSKSKYYMKNYCIFGVDNAKAETARIYFQMQEGVYSLTCENSLGLHSKSGKKGKETQFESKEWLEFGKDLITIILNVYDEYSSNEKDQLSERLLQDLTLPENDEEEEFMWQRSKTEGGVKMSEDFSHLALDIEEVDLPNQMTITQNKGEDNQSMNDSDNESENLSAEKHQKLIKIVRKTLSKNAPLELSNVESMKQSWARGERQESKMSQTNSRGNFINNFKQIRFGVEDATIADWYSNNRRRLFSIPKHLKTEKMTQSYLIRKKPPRSITQDQIGFTGGQVGKRVGSEEKEYIRKPSFDRSSNQLFISKQKMILDSLMMRKF